MVKINNYKVIYVWSDFSEDVQSIYAENEETAIETVLINTDWNNTHMDIPSVIFAEMVG